MTENTRPNTGRKLFFGLFVFPLIIAMGMAILLCSVIFLTHEEETPESLISAIKTGSPGKRWQKAFELSNELNRGKGNLRNESVMREIIHILRDPARYDAKTRGYMAIALSHFRRPEAIVALKASLKDPSPEVQLYTLWSLGILDAKSEAKEIAAFLKSDNGEIRKMAAYISGIVGGSDMTGPLRPLLGDPVADVRWNAALSLARLGDDAGFPVLAKMLERGELASLNMPDEEIEKVMINATKGLALIKKPESIKILENTSQSEKSLKVRQAALNALNYQRNGNA
ncbi:MAG: HEAT repeat domain-containing protein [Candidatus Omnitrophota bacterium]